MSLIDASLATLQPAPVFPELYQELWWHSGNDVAGTGSGTAGSGWVTKGTTALTTSSAQIIFTFTATWPASTKLAFECALSSQSTASTANAQLWDVTGTPVAVSGSQISTTSTNLTVVRSGQFTLTPGHKYGITIWSSNSAYNTNLTDASLIIFPSAPLTSPSVSAISLVNPSGNTLKEAYYPLWVYSSGTVSTTQTGVATSYLQKGSTSPGTALSVPTELYTLSSNWNSNQKFALEVSIFTSASGGTTYAALADITSNVTLTSVSTTSTTATVIRSSTLTLTPGHAYGVYIYTNNASYTAYLTKAHLIALAN